MTTRTRNLERENAALRDQLARHREFARLLLLWAATHPGAFTETMLATATALAVYENYGETSHAA